PFGLLHESQGAETGITSSSLNYDDVLSLFFSVNPEYRTNGFWIMNDDTALKVRKLKDENGNYLWDSATSTILNRPVLYCNNMPSVGNGNKPILFGDLSYYWVIDLSYPSFSFLNELFALKGMTGILAYKFLDARLIRRDAIKALAIGNNAN
ncbi:MAG: phage major capsid protein, partial [Sphaerochaetaceae bacterium]|nr:phage major capsid protein [Sphaerochaetaceae bacterium]